MPNKKGLGQVSKKELEMLKKAKPKKGRGLGQLSIKETNRGLGQLSIKETNMIKKARANKK